MLNMNFSESDWRLFRKKISKWQELYMDKLCEEYIAILSSTSRHSERFWRIEKCVNNDKKNVGVQVEMSRSKLVYNMVSLIYEGVIVLEDLDGFSEELKQAVKSKVIGV